MPLKTKNLISSFALFSLIALFMLITTAHSLAVSMATISLTPPPSTTLVANELLVIGVKVTDNEQYSGVDGITASPSSVGTNYCQQAAGNGSNPFTCNVTVLVTNQMVAAGSLTVTVTASITHAGSAPDTSISKSIKFATPKTVKVKGCKAGTGTAIGNGYKCTNENKVICNKGFVASGSGDTIGCADPAVVKGIQDAVKPDQNGGDIASGTCTTSAALKSCDLISKYIQPLINFMAALVGIAVVISIIVGGIQYASSADDPSKVTAAKNRIRNAIVALVAFLFLYAMLNFLIPGGLQ